MVSDEVMGSSMSLELICLSKCINIKVVSRYVVRPEVWEHMLQSVFIVIL